MPNQIFKIFLILVAFLLLPNFVWAAPAITSINGSFKDGQSVIISGSEFGSGATVLRWDDFENQIIGNQIKDASSKVGGIYGTTFVNHTNQAALIFSNEYVHSGSKAAEVNWTVAGDRSIGFGGSFSPLNEIYISYWRYMNYPSNTLPTTTNHKQLYLFGNLTDPLYGKTPQGISYIPQGEQTWGISNNNGGIAEAGTYKYKNGQGSKTWAGTTNKWNRWEYYIKLNSNPGCVMGSTCDGKRYEWIDSQFNFGDDLYYWQNNGGLYNQFWLGYMHGSGGTTPDVGQAYYDDLYIATSPARVEICDSLTWLTRNHCEIQPSQSWDTGSANITINKGTFSDAQAYLYVVDNNGNTNANGYPITFASAQVIYSDIDFFSLISNWFETGTTSNINSDGIVNSQDLGIVMSKWN